MIRILLSIVLATCSFSGTASGASLEFKNLSTRDVATTDSVAHAESAPNTRAGKGSLTTVSRESFTGVFLLAGKAVAPLSKSTLQRLRIKQPGLARDISKIHTSYEVMQNGQKFYIAGLTKVAGIEAKTTHCYESKSCVAEFDVVLVELTERQSKITVVIIESIRLP